MRFTIPHLKCDFHQRIQPIDFLCREITRCIERQTVKAGRQNFVVRHQLTAAATVISERRSQKRPLTGSFFPLQAYGYVSRRFALGRIQNMSCNAFYSESHFFTRICIISCCCSAASQSSVCSSCCNRRRSISRISRADLPAAHTMKM